MTNNVARDENFDSQLTFRRARRPLTALCFGFALLTPAIHANDEHHDRSTVIFDSKTPDQLACDTTLRKLPDGSWVMIMLDGGHTEPLPHNRVFLSRSKDQGTTWSKMQSIEFGTKSADPRTTNIPTELMMHGGLCTLFVATHDGTFADWKEWMTHSDN